MASSVWIVPAFYAVIALTGGLLFPRIEHWYFPELAAGLSISAAMAIYSSIASGMIALTGIVFSLVFVMVQFSATAYSPRLVLWVARSPLVSHALGVFTATFLYAIAALAWVDRSGNDTVPLISAAIVVLLLLASVSMLVGLIDRIALLSISRMLAFTGNRGRWVIEEIYPHTDFDADREAAGDDDTPTSKVRPSGKTPTQSVLHHGEPVSVQSIDVEALIAIAHECDGSIEVGFAIGDTISEATVLAHVYDAPRRVDERRLRRAIATGAERTFEQDPKYAIRLLVDIGIRALSPAINDPTTAVQAIDQIGDLLLRIGRRQLEIGTYADSTGRVRLTVPFPTWEDFLALSLDEIRTCGAGSVQVMRRLKALLADLQRALPEHRREALTHWENRIARTIARSFPDPDDHEEASEADRQGLGVTRRLSA
jgi:uncharacterized membrane protein